MARAKQKGKRPPGGDNMGNRFESATAVRAEVVAPFYYHGLYARDGSATHPAVITDTALVFALRAALLGPPSALSIEPRYREDLDRLPWRASLLLGEGNVLSGPVRHTIDVSREGGFHENMQKNMFSGNFKNTFFVHEVAVGACYYGLLLGPDPFELLQTGAFVLRVGVSRMGMVVLSRDDDTTSFSLNAATARLFGRAIPESYRILDTIRVSQPYSKAEAIKELKRWRINQDGP